MDPPKCYLCGDRHYGTCAKPVIPSDPRVRKSAKKKSRARSTVSLQRVTTTKLRPVPVDEPAQEHIEIDARTVGIPELLARIESLEARVLELEKRKKYMRKYMAEKRAEDKDG